MPSHSNHKSVWQPVQLSNTMEKGLSKDRPKFEVSYFSHKDKRFKHITQWVNKHVIRDIEKMLDELEIGHLKFEGTYQTPQSKIAKCYNLPKDLTLTLVTGYNFKLRKAIIDRWQLAQLSNTMENGLSKDRPKFGPIYFSHKDKRLKHITQQANKRTVILETIANGGVE
ncbi:Rha family transcriptional regulator [Polycladidibacter stylochi]|uniref:Rha family transcriptional regulator n=1 Tax=Polycladidibacter stylochi TaxID=1807766 RepID=UPI00082BFE0A|nr:Rha family transcriptional regulator [Pseudovibrio stylochi]